MRFAVYGDLSRTEVRSSLVVKPIQMWPRRVTPPCFSSVEYPAFVGWGNPEGGNPGLGWSFLTIGRIAQL